MGVIFLLAIATVACVVGLIGVMLGIIGLVAFGKRDPHGARRHPTLHTVSAVATCVGGGMLGLPLLGIGGLLAVNAIPPSDFVATPAVIEENGYQDTRFTVNGVVFESLERELASESARGEAVFSYYTKGLLNGSQCGNYYEVVNAGGFRLVCDHQGLLFCPTEERDAVLSYYFNPVRLQCLYRSAAVADEIPLSGEFTAAVLALLREPPLGESAVTVESDGSGEFFLRVISTDGAISFGAVWLLAHNGSVLLAESCTYTDPCWEYRAVALSWEQSDLLYGLYQSKQNMKGNEST